MRSKFTTVWNLRFERSSRLIHVISVHIIARWRHRCHHTYGYIGLLRKKNSRVWLKVKRYFVLCWKLIKSFWEIRSCSDNHFCNLRNIHTHTHTPIGYRKSVCKRRFRVWYVGTFLRKHNFFFVSIRWFISLPFMVSRFSPAMKLFQGPWKKSFTFYFRQTYFVHRGVKLAELSINSF